MFWNNYTWTCFTFYITLSSLQYNIVWYGDYIYNTIHDDFIYNVMIQFWNTVTVGDSTDGIISTVTSYNVIV